MKRAIFALGLLVFACCPPAFAAPRVSSNPAALALVDRALAASDLETHGAAAFRLQVRFRVYDGSGKSLDGKLLRIWTPMSWWHEEAEMPGYQSVEVSDGRQVWRAGNLDYLPFPIFLLWQALDLGDSLRAAKGRPLGPPEASAAGFGTCVATLERPGNSQYCFDRESGDLLRLVDGAWNVTFEYSHYLPFGSKRFPRDVRILRNGGQALAELRVEELAPERDPSLNVFLPMPGAKEWSVAEHCAHIVKPSVKKMIRPEYPQAANKAGITGIVRLYAEIGADGIPRGLWPINAVPRVLSQAAIEAVSQWRYDPETCVTTGKTLPTVQRITVLFVSE